MFATRVRYAPTVCLGVKADEKATMGEGTSSTGRGGGTLAADPQAMRRELEEELRELESRLSRSTRSLEERLRNLGKMQDGIVVPPPLELVLPSASPLNKYAAAANESFSPVSSAMGSMLGATVSANGEVGERDEQLEKYRVRGMEGSSHSLAQASRAVEEGSALPTPTAVVAEEGERSQHFDHKDEQRALPKDELSDFEDEEEEEEHDELAGDGPVVGRTDKREQREVTADESMPKETYQAPDHSRPAKMTLPTNVLRLEDWTAMERDKEREEIEKRRKAKEDEYEQELRQLQARLKQKAEEKVELEETRQRHAEELSLAQDETREARKVSSELQKEILQLQKRLNEEMKLSNSKDEELQKMQRKFPAMLRELESLSSRNATLLKEKEDLMRQVNDLRKELMQLKDESHSWRQQERQTKSDLEQHNQRLTSEVFDLNTRLTETVLLVSELRSKEERSQDAVMREVNQKEELKRVIKELEKDKRELNASLTAAAESGDSRRALADEQETELRKEVEALKKALKRAKDSASDEVLALQRELSEAHDTVARSQHEEEDFISLEQQLQAERNRSLELQQLAQSYQRQLKEVLEEQVQQKEREARLAREREDLRQKEEEEEGERDVDEAPATAVSAPVKKKIAAEQQAVDRHAGGQRSTPKKSSTISQRNSTPNKGSTVQKKSSATPTRTARTPTVRQPISRRTPVKKAPENDDEFDEAVDDSEVPIVEERELRGRLYTPRRGDEIDELLATIIRSKMADGLELLPPNFERISRGIYQFGTKKINVKVHDRQPVIRVGGGFMTFTKFVKKFGRSECMRISKVNHQVGHHSDRTSPVHQALHRTSRRTANSPA